MEKMIHNVRSAMSAEFVYRPYGEYRFLIWFFGILSLPFLLLAMVCFWQAKAVTGTLCLLLMIWGGWTVLIAMLVRSYRIRLVFSAEGMAVRRGEKQLAFHPWASMGYGYRCLYWGRKWLILSPEALSKKEAARLAKQANWKGDKLLGGSSLVFHLFCPEDTEALLACLAEHITLEGPFYYWEAAI